MCWKHICFLFYICMQIQNLIFHDKFVMGLYFVVVPLFLYSFNVYMLCKNTIFLLFFCPLLGLKACLCIFISVFFSSVHLWSQNVLSDFFYLYGKLLICWLNMKWSYLLIMKPVFALYIHQIENYFRQW